MNQYNSNLRNDHRGGGGVCWRGEGFYPSAGGLSHGASCTQTVTERSTCWKRL